MGVRRLHVQSHVSCHGQVRRSRKRAWWRTALDPGEKSTTGPPNCIPRAGDGVDGSGGRDNDGSDGDVDSEAKVFGQAKYVDDWSWSESNWDGLLRTNGMISF